MMNMSHPRNSVIFVIAIYCAIFALTGVSAFSPSLTSKSISSGAKSNLYSSKSYVSFRSITPVCNTKFKTFPLFSSNDDVDPNAEEDYSSPPEEAKNVAPVEKNSPAEDESSLPLDVPSPILLASSIVLAIAATGSTFQLAGGDPPNGLAITASIIAVSLPSSAFLFYAAILKGQAETDADDKEFQMKNRGRF